MALPRMLIDGIAVGQDVSLSFTGTEDVSAWTLTAYISQDLSGDPITSGVTVLADGTTLNVFIPKADTESLTPGEDSPLYLDVWREDAGDEYPIVEATIPVYKSVRGS